MSVNPKTVFELDEIFAHLKVEAFKNNNLAFFRNFQNFLESNCELPNYHFYPKIFFREGNTLHPQQHEYSFSELLRRNKSTVISSGVWLRIRYSSISYVNMSNISTVVMTEEELLGTLYCLLKGDSLSGFNKENYYYLYSVSGDGKIFSKVWINWKGDYWSIKSSEGSSICEHKFGGADVLIVV